MFRYLFFHEAHQSILWLPFFFFSWKNTGRLILLILTFERIQSTGKYFFKCSGHWSLALRVPVGRQCGVVGTGANTGLVHCVKEQSAPLCLADCSSWECGPKVASPPRFSIGAGNLTFYVKYPNFEVLQKKTPGTRSFSK